MNNNELNVSNKKSAGKGNGNSVINNHEYSSNNRSGSSSSAGQNSVGNAQNKAKQ